MILGVDDGVSLGNIFGVNEDGEDVIQNWSLEKKNIHIGAL